MDKVLRDFISYLSVEKGLAANTLKLIIVIYRHLRFLKSRGITAFESVKEMKLQPTCAVCKKGRAASTLSRNLASIRSFTTLSLEKRIDENPTADGVAENRKSCRAC